MMDFSFESIENVQRNWHLFDEDFNRIKLKQESQANQEIYKSLQSGSLDSFFSSKVDDVSKKNEELPRDLTKYLNQIQQRFEKTKLNI